MRYRKHARDRMRDRGITEEDVEWALRRPTGPPGAGEPGTYWQSGMAAGGRILRVCLDAADPEVVITLAWSD